MCDCVTVVVMPPPAQHVTAAVRQCQCHHTARIPDDNSYNDIESHRSQNSLDELHIRTTASASFTRHATGSSQHLVCQCCGPTATTRRLVELKKTQTAAASVQNCSTRKPLVAQHARQRCRTLAATCSDSDSPAVGGGIVHGGRLDVCDSLVILYRGLQLLRSQNDDCVAFMRRWAI
jgi:hypothetical protein